MQSMILDRSGKSGIRQRVLAVLLFTSLLSVLLVSPANAAPRARLDKFSPRTDVVRLDRADGKSVRAEVANDVRVRMVDSDGDVSRGDINELVRGAKVLGWKKEDGEIVKIRLRERATGSSDCSFDTGDGTTDDNSFDCSNDYDDGNVDTDSDCSFDESGDGPANDRSEDVSWDCSYDKSIDGDDISWDCSFSASSSRYADAWGGDVDADLDFDCSWGGDGVAAGTKLWECKFKPGVLGFRCASPQLNQEFEYEFDPATAELEGGLDFRNDYVDTDEPSDGDVGCSGSAADGYDCSFDYEQEAGDCSADWDYDASREGTDGDVSGSLSYSCSWDA